LQSGLRAAFFVLHEISTGTSGDDLAIATFKSILRQAGPTAAKAAESLREAIAFHLDGMREDGLPIPEPMSTVEYLDVAA
jgi:predicted RNase H-like HicB family nuclease